MAELHRVSTFAIVACNIARNLAGVEASSTSATFCATIIALCVCLLQHCMQWCDVTRGFYVFDVIVQVGVVFRKTVVAD